jgi:TRAP-type C4-dicarboxylate transport system substrate-binding protein
MKPHIAIMAAVAMATSVSVAQAETWDMPMAYADSNFHTQVGKQFAQCVGTATGGDLEITVHGGGSLFKGGEIKRAVQTGQVQIGERLLSSHQNEEPVYGIDSVPFLATSFEASEKLSAAGRDTLVEKLKDDNLHYLYSVPWPPQGFYFNKEVNSVADMEGVKFRSYNSATARLAELTGMVPTQIEAAEISQAFATGVVEAMISSGATGYDRKLWEHVSNFYAVDGWLPRNTVMVNLEAWEDLDEGHQNALTACAEMAADLGLYRSMQYTDFTLNGLRAGGMSVEDASEQMVTELKEIGAQMTAEWLEAAGDEGQAIVDTFSAE